MLHIVFGTLMGSAILYGMITGQANAVVSAMMEAAAEAVRTALMLAGGFAFFCGMIALPRRAGAAARLGKRLSPFLRRLMGGELPEDALESVTMNLTANMLGLSNAATPMGLEAARRMARNGQAASNALCLFLVINSSSVQLMPTTVIALRAAEGSAEPGAIALPALLATLISTVTGILACKIGEKLS